MSNLRIIYNNVADTATITASSTAAGFSVDNLKNTQKTSVHRSTGNNVVYTLTWAAYQQISAVALPATNLTVVSNIQVQFYDTVQSPTPFYDTGVIRATGSEKTILLQGGITEPTYKDFGFGGATKTSIWLATTLNTKKVVITIFNGTPIDCARIICGTFWESSRQASNGISIDFSDSSEVTATRSGNTYVDRKPITNSISLDLEYLNDLDRQELLKIMRSWGSSGLIYLCVFPGTLNSGLPNEELNETYTIYGRSQNNSVQYKLFSLYGTSLTINSW